MRNLLLNCKLTLIVIIFSIKLSVSSAQGISYIYVDTLSSTLDNYVHLRYFMPQECKIRRRIVETKNDTLRYNYYSICQKSGPALGNYFTDTFTVSKQQYNNLCAIQFLTFADTTYSLDTSFWDFIPEILFWDSLSYPINYCTPLSILNPKASYLPLYPNPARNELELPFEPNLISDLNGKRMRPNYKNKKLDVSEYPPGYYLIRTEQGSYQFYKE